MTDEEFPTPDLKPDELVSKLPPRGIVSNTTVTFRGWLGAPDDTGIHRFYTSPALDEWLEINAADIAYRESQAAAGEPLLALAIPKVGGKPTPPAQQPGATTIWVKHDAYINRCEAAEAFRIAAEEYQLTDPTGAKYPKYGG
jgi:hypothetical protein